MVITGRVAYFTGHASPGRAAAANAERPRSMTSTLLVATVAAVGVFHTLVPDHWAPIVVIGRQQGWSIGRTARAAAIAGFGHVASTLVLGLVLWAADATQHVHWHEHHQDDWHTVEGGAAVMHQHEHAIAGRTALVLILGSSPMIEGVPAFFAASTYGLGLIAVMAGVFALATIVTYVAASCFAIAGLQRVSLGPLERYGEVLSGTFVALVGVYALITA